MGKKGKVRRKSDERTLVEHLAELRKRLLVIVIFFSAFSVIGFYISDIIIARINADLFPAGLGVRLIVTQPVEFLYTKMNVGLFFGLVLTIPLILYQFFAFVRPALIRHERKIIIGAVLAGFGLFVAGAAFSYFVLLRFTIWFLAGLASSAGIANLWNINYFISFIFLFCIMMGFVFQLPLITTLALKFNLVKLEDLRKKRGYVIVIVFLVAAVITPTIDPVTQCIVAVPMLVLYEISIMAARIFA